MNTLDKSEVLTAFRHLDSLKELTDLLRRAHFDVPYRVVYEAVGAEVNLRNLLLDAAVTGVEVEALSEKDLAHVAS